MNWFYDSEVIFQLILAVILGGLIGLEREYKRREAGLRTYSLVSLGSCLFALIGFYGLQGLIKHPGVSLAPIRVIQAIAIGIGFIGGGSIVYRQFRVEGLTTAAGLWIVAAIGIAVGAKLYFPAILATFLTVFILAGFRVLEEKFLRTKGTKGPEGS